MKKETQEKARNSSKTKGREARTIQAHSTKRELKNKKIGSWVVADLRKVRKRNKKEKEGTREAKK